MVDLVPELKLIIGEQSPVPELPPQDAQRRFQLFFRRFLAVFARPEHPLALFLDDLQWLDAATLDLLEDLLTHPDLRHLLLIGAYRDNEVTAAHPLMRKLETIRATGRVQDIKLAPLTGEDLQGLVTDTLHMKRNKPSRSQSYCTPRLTAIRFSRSSFFACSPRRVSSPSTTSRRDGPSTSAASMLNSTRTTSSSSWPGS